METAGYWWPEPQWVDICVLWIVFHLIIILSGFPRRITTAFSHGSQCEQAQ